jgi:hypothetical protein
MSFCAIPESRSAVAIAAISFELASVASLTVLALVVTPPLIRAWSGGTLMLPSPVTITRPSGGDCGCCACAVATKTTAARKQVPHRSARKAA